MDIFGKRSFEMKLELKDKLQVYFLKFTNSSTSINLKASAFNCKPKTTSQQLFQPSKNTFQPSTGKLLKN